MPEKKERPTPSLRARLLGRRLRALREDRGLTLKYVAASLGLDFTSVRLLEVGEWKSHRGEVLKLLDLYGVHDPGERDFLLRLARDVYRLPAWEGDFNASQLDVSTLDGLWLESVAERIRCYQAALIPDLLRIPEYAEAVVHREHASRASEVELAWRVRAYSRRQREVFDRRPQVDIHAVVAEAALHRPVGAPDPLWRAQLEHLAKGGDGGRVQVRVLPTTAAYVSGMDGSFTVFDLPHEQVPVVASRPHLDSIAVHEGAAGQWHVDTFDRLWDEALPAVESARLITALVEDRSTHSN
ncbi:DUF5753 domain-containing protein [Phytohabitans suffuscus]|nr:DUF5753 domain-containing protein [Phytohabitans suffuscus]